MARTNKVLNNIVGGEVQPELYGRVDLPTFQKAVARCENFIVLAQGGAKFRQGTVYVKSTRGNKTAVFIPFCFNDQQTFLIEATNTAFRFYTDNAAVLETGIDIVGITNANPGVVNAIAHGYTTGDEIFITGTNTELDGYFFIVATSGVDHLTLRDVVNDNSIDTTNYIPFVSGGTVSRVYQIATPFVEADLEDLAFTQNADTMYFAHQNYAPRKLVRMSNTNWTLSTPALTGDPFAPDDSDHWPGAVAFIDSARLVFAGSRTNPETIWGSNAPSVGTTDFENFSVGVADTDGFVFTIAPVHGKVDAIQWIASTSKFIVLGTFGSMRILYGATIDAPISPTSVTAKSINAYGCKRTLPATTGLNLFYVQRGGRLMRSVEYDIITDSYITVNRNLVSEHLTIAGYKQIVQQQFVRDIIWGCMNDGRLIGMTYSAKEDISGWSRHYIAGQSRDENGRLINRAKVLWIGIMPRIDTGGIKGDQLWLVVEREINGQTLRTVEFVNDEPTFPDRENFYTSDANKETDSTTFQNVLYEAQKDASHLDMSIGFDGTINTPLIVNPA